MPNLFSVSAQFPPGPVSYFTLNQPIMSCSGRTASAARQPSQLPSRWGIAMRGQIPDPEWSIRKLKCIVLVIILSGAFKLIILLLIGGYLLKIYSLYKD